MPRWTEVEMPAPLTRAAADRRKVRPPRHYVTEFDTEVDAERAAFLRLMLNPLPVLTGQAVDRNDHSEEETAELAGLVLEGVHEGWRVVTTILNHHKGLNPRINFSSVTVSDEEETVYHEVYKQLD